MSNKRIEWGKEIAQAGNDVAELAKDAGIPGIGLLATFAQNFYERHLQKRFSKFLSDAEIDQEMIGKILADENYANYFYAALETVRQTHSKIGVAALALIYKDHWNDEVYLIAATRAFSQVSDRTLEAFLSLYESIQPDKDYLELRIRKGDEYHFHDLYNEGVELIGRNFFVLSTGASMHANGPIQGMKWAHTDSYYRYCRAAKAHV
ncbi:hypothetical protein [uncultured Sphaerotilus sp.]|uniref:hypothetical protein n=1 Tax=uncultured Sphaerotilus sp. TaxID=474984 RepID=UPI0030CA3E34